MLEPIKVIIQDFPKFISEYFNLSMFSVLTKCSVKIRVNVHKAINKMFTIKNNIKDKYALILFKSKFTIKNSIKLIASVKIIQTASLKIKTSFKSNGVDGLIKILQRGRGKAVVAGMKSYLDPKTYIIGVATTLGYWDGAVNENYLKKFDNSSLMTLDQQKLVSLDGTHANTMLSTMDVLTMYDISLIKSSN